MLSKVCILDYKSATLPTVPISVTIFWIAILFDILTNLSSGEFK